MSTEYEISVLLPTRGRARQAEAMLRGLIATADRPERIELILRVDADDADSHTIGSQGLAVTRLIRPRAMMGVMTNECYRVSRGRHILLANDDVVFRTKEWDGRFLDALAEFRDGIGFVWGNDGFTGGPTHPILPRRLCKRLGGVCPNAYDRVFIDVHLHDLFQKLKSRGHDRMRYLADVHIEHIHSDAGKCVADATSQKTHLRDDEMVYIHYEEEREAVAGELADFIAVQNSPSTSAESSHCNNVLARAA